VCYAYCADCVIAVLCGSATFEDRHTMPSAEDELYITPALTPICALDCFEAFNGLTDGEKQYSHFLSTASWAGALACLVQTSPESPKIFALFMKLFTADLPETLQQKSTVVSVLFRRPMCAG
jgi:hypothetical protein